MPNHRHAKYKEKGIALKCLQPDQKQTIYDKASMAVMLHVQRDVEHCDAVSKFIQSNQLIQGRGTRR